MPATCRSCGASLGAAITVRAGSTAWPARVAGKACWAMAGVAAAHSSAAQAAIWDSRDMVVKVKRAKTVDDAAAL